MWDERYSAREYIYGTEPNQYFRETLLTLQPGSILLPGEGEGRNAVFAASKGWKVTAFDTSAVGQKKALRLAKEKNVDLDYQLVSYDQYEPGNLKFDVVGLFFTHQPQQQSHQFHRKIISWLKPGGNIIMEAFHKGQISRNTGGPGNVDYLFDQHSLTEDFHGLKIIELKDLVTTLDEGAYHQGKAHVIRYYGMKQGE